MKVVVTGASGFLGTAAVRALRGCGMQVTAVDRERLADPPGGDALIHLAESGERRLVASGGERYEAEVLGRLDALLAKGYRTSIYISSALVYGDASSEAHKESEVPRPADAYARLKVMCEARALESGAVVLRVANVYGPGMAPNNVISTVLAQIPREGPLQVMDQGPRRDFLWIADLAEALARAAQRGAGPAIINIGSGIATSIGELARLALRIAGQPERPVISSKPSDASSCVVLDPSAAEAKLGWRAATSLDKGLAMLLGKA